MRLSGPLRGVASIVSGSVAGQAVVILTYPLLTRLYDPGDFGLFTVFASVASMVAVASTASLEAADRFELSVAAKRKVRKVRIVKRRVRTRRGVRIKRRRKVRIKRYYLIRNPRTCSGSWPYEVRLDYPSGQRVVSGSVSCTP